MDDTAETEYLRGKLQERTGNRLHQHAPAQFDSSGPALWAARSGRTYYDEESPNAEALDYSSPVTGNGKLTITHGGGMGNLSRIVGGKKTGAGLRHRTKRLPEPHPAHGGARGLLSMTQKPEPIYFTDPGYKRKAEPKRRSIMDEVGEKYFGGASDDYQTNLLLNASGGRSTGAAATGGARAKRGALVSKLMRERGVTLGEASAIIKREGLM